MATEEKSPLIFLRLPHHSDRSRRVMFASTTRPSIKTTPDKTTMATSTTQSHHGPISARRNRAMARLRRSAATTKTPIDHDGSTVSSSQDSSTAQTKSVVFRGQASTMTSTSSTVERPSFTSIETPELLFRVDSTESTQSDSSTLVALREKVKQLDGLLDDLQEKVIGDGDNFDEDGIIEEIYSLEFSEQRLRQELHAVDVLLAPTLSAETRDANASTLLDSLSCESLNTQGVIVTDDAERAPPPDCCGDDSVCNVSGLNYYYTIATHNAWSSNFMEEEEVEIVYDKEKKDTSGETPKSLSSTNLTRPYPLEFSGRPAEEENPVPMTPCSCISADTHESNILRLTDPYEPATTPRTATDREIQILSIPTLDQVGNSDSGFFCCMNRNIAAFGCEDDNDLFLSPEYPPSSTRTGGQTSPSTSSQVSSQAFSPLCDLNKERLSTISEGLSTDLLSPRHRQWSRSGSRLGLYPFKEGGDMTTGSSVFDGLPASKDETTESGVLSPSTHESAQTRKMFNFEKKKPPRKEVMSKDARALRTPISIRNESDMVSSSCSSSTDDRRQPQHYRQSQSSSMSLSNDSDDQHQAQQYPPSRPSPMSISESLKYELQFGVSDDLLSSTDASSHHQERMHPGFRKNIIDRMEAAKDALRHPKTVNGNSKATIASNVATKSPVSHTQSSSSRRRRPFGGRPPVSPQKRSDKSNHLQPSVARPHQNSLLDVATSTTASPFDEPQVPAPMASTPIQVGNNNNQEQTHRKLCLEAESIYRSDYGEIHTPHHGEDVVSPLPSFRSTDRLDDEDSIGNGTVEKPIMMHSNDDYQLIDQVPTDERNSVKSQPQEEQKIVKVVNSYDDPTFFRKKQQEEDEDDAIVDTLARIYMRVHVGQLENKKDDPMFEFDSIKEAIYSGTFDEDYGIYCADDDSVHDAISRLAKRIQAKNFSSKKQDKLENGHFFAFLDNAVECVLSDDICQAPCDFQPPQKAVLENDDTTYGDIVPSPTSHSNLFVEAEKCYLEGNPMSLHDEGEDTYCSDESPQLKLVASVNAPVTSSSKKAPSVPVREELPSLGAKLVFRDPTGDCTASVGDLTELKERKRRIESDLQLEKCFTDQDCGGHRANGTPRRRQQYGRVFQPGLEDSPTPRIRNLDMTKSQAKGFELPAQKNFPNKKGVTKVRRSSASSDDSSVKASKQQDTTSQEINELLDCNNKLLQSIAKFDFSTYQSLVSDDLTGVDPASKGKVQRRHAFHRYYLDHSTLADISMLTPCVRFLSDEAAVVTYIRLDHVVERDGTPNTKRTSETRVWEKEGSGNGKGKTWKNCHFHQSEAS